VTSSVADEAATMKGRRHSRIRRRGTSTLGKDC
jgi:hypothetical protein